MVRWPALLAGGVRWPSLVLAGGIVRRYYAPLSATLRLFLFVLAGGTRWWVSSPRLLFAPSRSGFLYFCAGLASRSLACAVSARSGKAHVAWRAACVSRRPSLVLVVVVIGGSNGCVSRLAA